MRCGIILIRKNVPCNDFLIVYSKKSRKWGFPKGGVEKNETMKEAALREFYEETGYKFTFNIPLSKVFQYLNNIYYIVTILNPEKELVETMIPDSEEILEKKWISTKDLLEMNDEKCNMGLKQWILFLKKKSKQK